VKAVINLSFDVRSPYAWIAFESLLRYETIWPIDLRMKPALLGGILRDAGNLGGPPLNNKFRGEYMFRDLKLLGEYWKLPFNQPKDPMSSVMKQSSVLPNRFLLALQDQQQQDHSKQFQETARRFWTRIWSQDLSIGEEKDVRQVAKDVGITNVDELLKKSTSAEIKEKLKNNSDAVNKVGGFGVPWITITLTDGTKHQLFGSDRLHIIGHLIGEKFIGPINEKAAKM